MSYHVMPQITQKTHLAKCKMNCNAMSCLSLRHVCCHARVGGFLRGASSLASSDQLVAMDTLHQTKIPIDNLEMVPPRTTSAFARHCGRKERTSENSVIDIFILSQIVCSNNIKQGSPLPFRLPKSHLDIFTLHAFLE